MQYETEPLILAATLEGFGPSLMAHASASSARQLAPIALHENVGAVLTAPSQNAAQQAVRVMRKANPSASLLLDAQQYAGKDRSFGAHPLSKEWFHFQRSDLMLPWGLTDSWYVPDGNHSSLRELLRQGTALGSGVIVALPLALSWLTTNVEALIAEIESAGVPVALMLEHEKDPLAQKGAISGLIKAINCSVPVLVLRSDVAAIGAIACGAAAAAIGTTSSRRHIYPILEGDSSGRIQTSAVVSELLTYKRLETIEDAIIRNPSLSIWHCGCFFCKGNSLEWILNAPDPSAAAFQHSIAALARVSREVMSTPTTAEQRKAWLEKCAVAQINHDQVLTAGGNPWIPRPVLKRWRTETGPLPAHA